MDPFIHEQPWNFTRTTMELWFIFGLTGVLIWPAMLTTTIHIASLPSRDPVLAEALIHLDA